MGFTEPYEEECLPHYCPDQFYPVHVGQHLGSGYKVMAKLGYSAHSTVWLCWDIRNDRHVAIKVCTLDTNKASTHRELQFYEHVSSLGSNHPGQAFIRGLLGTFEIAGPAGQHLCLVHPPMHMTIRELQYMNSACRLNAQLLRWTLSNILQALSFLHDEANVIHADINPSNIMLTVADEQILEDVVRSELTKPLPRKVINQSRIIYGSHRLGLPRDSLWGEPVLCDFGEARIGPRHRGLIQPELYRAPEVLFDMEWDSKVDTWSVATLIWDLLGNKHLFNAVDENQQSSATHQVAEMVGYLGLPPSEYIQRSKVTRKVFDDRGHWKGAGGTRIPNLSLEQSLSVLDDKTERSFFDFIRKMLRWVPEERAKASELLQDQWLNDTTKTPKS